MAGRASAQAEIAGRLCRQALQAGTADMHCCQASINQILQNGSLRYSRSGANSGRRLAPWGNSRRRHFALRGNVGSHTATPNKAISQKNNGHILTPVSAIENGHILTLHWPVQKKMVKAALISNFTQQNHRLVAAR